MVKENDKENTDVTEGAFVKSDDKQNVPTSGVSDGINYADSLPGGGLDNDSNSSIITGDSEDDEFDHRTEDEPRS